MTKKNPSSRIELITNVRNHANLWLLLQEQGKIGCQATYHLWYSATDLATNIFL